LFFELKDLLREEASKQSDITVAAGDPPPTPHHHTIIININEMSVGAWPTK
jgi:hypothetical protein